MIVILKQWLLLELICYTYLFVKVTLTNYKNKLYTKPFFQQEEKDRPKYIPSIQITGINRRIIVEKEKASSISS